MDDGFSSEGVYRPCPKCGGREVRWGVLSADMQGLRCPRCGFTAALPCPSPVVDRGAFAWLSANAGWGEALMERVKRAWARRDFARVETYVACTRRPTVEVGGESWMTHWRTTVANVESASPREYRRWRGLGIVAMMAAGDRIVWEMADGSITLDEPRTLREKVSRWFQRSSEGAGRPRGAFTR